MQEPPPQLESLFEGGRKDSERLENSLGRRVEAWLETLSDLGMAWAFQKDPGNRLWVLNGPGQEDLGIACDQEEEPELPAGRKVVIQSQGLMVWLPRGDGGALSLDSLTAREKESYTWMKKGKTVMEAAIILGISPRTVEKHRENAMRKLDLPQ